MRQGVGEQIRERRRAGTHRRDRNQPEKLADLRTPTTKFITLGTIHSGRRREAREGQLGVL
jgi:hypothetical protein